jgi:hypothetical protein
MGRKTTTTLYDGEGNIQAREETISQGTGCGCSVLVVLALLILPASMASQGTYPGDWPGAALTYLAAVIALTWAVRHAMNKARPGH